jgi:HK97 family phage prohead protease
LKLSEDSKGLHFELALPDTSYARDLGILVERGDIAGCSFGFQVPTGGDAWELRDGTLTRDLINVNLHEITITGNPAYLDTTVAKRSMEAWHQSVELNEFYWMRTV